MSVNKVTVTERSDATQLIAVTEVRERLGLDSADDSLLTDLGLEAQSLIETYLGRPLTRQKYTETIPGRNQERIYITNLPLDPDSITLTIDGTANTDYVIESNETGQLYLSGGWPDTLEQDISATYHAGYLLPGQIGDWTASTAYAAQTVTVAPQWVRPTKRHATPLIFECTTAGTTNSTEPTWTSTGGGTVTDNSATWTARASQEIPYEIRRIAWMTVKGIWDARTRPAGLRRIEADGFSESYSDGSEAEGLPDFLRQALDRWRHRL